MIREWNGKGKYNDVEIQMESLEVGLVVWFEYQRRLFCGKAGNMSIVCWETGNGTMTMKDDFW